MEAAKSLRELDAQIAQHVMEPETLFREVDEEWPNYSGDDALALQVADKVGLFEKGYFLALYANDGKWYVRAVGTVSMRSIATGTTRAEALCRAALILATEGK